LTDTNIYNTEQPITVLCEKSIFL